MKGTIQILAITLVLLLVIAFVLGVGLPAATNTRPESAPSANHNLFTVTIGSADDLTEAQKEDVEWVITQDGKSARTYETRADGWATVTDSQSGYVDSITGILVGGGIVVFLLGLLTFIITAANRRR